MPPYGPANIMESNKAQRHTPTTSTTSSKYPIMDSESRMEEAKSANSALVPPQLPLSTQEKKKSIVIAWSIIVFTNFVLPNVLWFALQFGTNLSDVAVYSIPTSIFGAITVPSIILRLYYLLQKDDKYRPLNAGRWEIDFFMVNYLIGFVVNTLLISLGIAFQRYKLVCLPFLYIQTLTSVQIFFTWVFARFTNAKSPMKFSSLAKGTRMRNALFTIIEDVVAVDGGGGKEYRAAWNERWLASRDIRRLLDDAALLWGISGTVVGVACIAVIALIDDKAVDWAMGWIVPPVWAAVMAMMTINLTRATLKRERENWKEDRFVDI